MKQETLPFLKEVVKHLLNREFQIASIKEHLLSRGYSAEVVECILEEAAAGRSK